MSIETSALVKCSDTWFVIWSVVTPFAGPPKNRKVIHHYHYFSRIPRFCLLGCCDMFHSSILNVVTFKQLLNNLDTQRFSTKRLCHACRQKSETDGSTLRLSSFFSLSVTMVMTWQISTFVTTMVTERSGGGMVSNQRTMRNIHSEFNFYCTLRHLQFWMVYSTYFWKRKNGCCLNPFPLV